MKNSGHYYIGSVDLAGINFTIIASHEGITNIFMNNRKAVDVKNSSFIKLHFDDPYFFGTVEQLKEYFNGERKNFNIPLDLRGTDFQKKVWKELLKIPYGETISYKILSERVHNPGAVRAVGSANGANPIPIIVPCHRVINSNGKLGGYSGGLNIKEKLLELEGSLSLELFERQPDQA